MPELAEVEYYRKQWDPGLGQAVRRVAIHDRARIFRETSPNLLRRRLPGRHFEGSEAHGKNLLFRFSDGAWVGGHLGMTGKTHVAPPDFEPGKHDHLVIYLESLALVFTDPRLFGRIRFELVDPGPPDWWSELPPAVLDPGFSRDRVAEFARRRRRTPVKTLLLDQAVFPGIGNWMADEICWRLRWHPGRPAGTLDEAEADHLRRETRHVSRKALEIIGQDWGAPPKSWLFRHRWKDGGHCPRRGCGEALVRADLRGRTTCWCPRCQGEET